MTPDDAVLKPEMNLDSSTNQPLEQPLDRLLSPATDAAIELPPPPTQIPDNPNHEDQESSDLESSDLESSDLESSDLESSDLEAESAAKFTTLLLDTPDFSADRDLKILSKGGLKYVQGVVHGQQAYLITNLLRGESQTLFQPQMVWTIGRNRDAAFPLPDRSLSRRHAVILFVQDQGFQLIDLNSMNGSFVNKVQVQQRCPLNDGDDVCLGSAKFTFLSSRSYRTIEAVHPEILARFTTPKLKTGEFLD